MGIHMQNGILTPMIFKIKVIDIYIEIFMSLIFHANITILKILVVMNN